MMKPCEEHSYPLFGTREAIGAVLWGMLTTILVALNAVSPGMSQDRPKESVTVTAVEVPVRVFDKNGFVGGLAKDDFEVFENGVRQMITGFESVARAISPVKVEMPGAIPRAARPRNFLLIFNVWDYTDQIGEGVDYFFKNVFGPGDKLLILIEDKFFNIETSGGIERTIADLKETLIRFKHASRYEISRAFLNLDVQAARLAALNSGQDPDEIEDTHQATQLFFDEYLRLWLDYRIRMLDPDLDLYRSAVRALSRAEGERWAICFQQRDVFPHLRSGGPLERSLRDDTYAQTRIMQMKKEMDIVRNYPQAAIRDIFADANITFHLLLMKSVVARASNESRDLELDDVDAEYENTLHTISRSTGGMTLFSNKVAETLKEAAAKEDRHYLLVYQSRGTAALKERKIDVKVRREGADVVSLKRYVGSVPGGIAITGFQSEGKRLAFDIGGCGRVEQGARNSGKVRIAVTVFDEKSIKVYNETKAFDLIADSIHLSLSFDKLAAGTHFVILEAVDLVTGDKDVYSRALNW
jgi:hypothetical protein